MKPFTIASRWSSWTPRLQSILRIVAGVLFTLTGAMKLFAFPAALMPGGGPVPLVSEIGLAAVLETFGGAFLVLGLFARPVAFLLSGEMAVAYFQSHAPHSLWPPLNGGIPAILFCILWLYFSAAGAGVWSLDHKRHRQQDHTT